MRALFLISLMLWLPACSAGVKDVKSPCVGAEDSPCGPRRAVNG